MKRGDVYNVRLDPVEGSEQGGSRPVIVVSRNAINANSPTVLAIPCTTYRPGKRIYATQVLIAAPEGGLSADSIALAEQVRILSKSRFGDYRGSLSIEIMEQISTALALALDLPTREDFEQIYEN
ncbi:type II toxin-antitoxin system PemK/MazF family toxin [Chamaesiphon minutus]|uniref:mRNA interferase n=1 Tax=Chamaesiphon minutus (strain ATCC 27169 / PCC 6605) TaxID=1173020 RepID=K9UG17_CHAP6|nr:type II toxin-antitoxin system PemK/MazF family toxin [Chamaesiphon minutus]AFY93346.1 growth inhibitor [Chamaesiphon minutus PCC 6605]